MLNSVTAFVGLTAGSLGAAALVTYAPDPRHFVYLVLLALSAVEMLILWYMPETVSAKPGAFASLRPHVHVPAQARRALFQVTPVTIASWALGGFYFSLMPSLVRVATGVTLPIVGGLVVAALTFSGAVAVLSLRNVAAARVLGGGIPALAFGVAVTLAGVGTQFVGLMLAGTVISGIGFGAAFAGAMRTVMPLAQAHERAGLLSAFYVEGYLSFSLPAILTGLLAPMTGLPWPLTYMAQPSSCWPSRRGSPWRVQGSGSAPCPLWVVSRHHDRKGFERAAQKWSARKWRKQSRRTRH